jgi:hypothetical protein
VVGSGFGGVNAASFNAAMRRFKAFLFSSTTCSGVNSLRFLTAFFFGLAAGFFFALVTFLALVVLGFFALVFAFVLGFLVAVFDFADAARVVAAAAADRWAVVAKEFFDRRGRSCIV